jgi:NitT/TauT family transport system ATP-binding protein
MATLAPEPLLRLRDITQAYRKGGTSDLLVLDGINMNLWENQIVGLLGRSGCGKSTILRIVAGLIAPTSGDVQFRDKIVSGPVPGVAMVFQTFALFPWLTVLENVELGLEALGIAADERRQRALTAIDLIGLDGFESAYPKELSGGMRQRVGLARALVVHPDVLLMDEPFSALDVLTAETLRTDLIDLWIEGRLPIKSALMVTHNIEEAVLMCDRVIVLSPNPGRIALEIAINLSHPRNRLDASFRQYVGEIYALMTKRQDPHSPTIEGIPGTGIGMVLPSVSTNEMAGLLEALATPAAPARVELSDIARTLQLEVDELFPIAEILQLLRFAEMEAGCIRVTDGGRAFAEADTDQRKRLFAERLEAHVPLIRLIRRVLDERPGHVAPLARFRGELEDYMSEEYAEETLRAVINWGRYAEILAYDEETERLSLEDPS